MEPTRFEHSICKECLREQRSDKPCRAHERRFGGNVCARRKDGTYSDDPLTWDDDRCLPCSPGEYATEDLVAINK